MIRGFFNHRYTRRVIILLVFLGIVAGLIYGGIMLANQKDLQSEVAKKSTPKTSSGGGSGSSTPVNRPPTYVELTDEEKGFVTRVIEDSPMVDAIPTKYPISFQIFYFEDGYRVWQNKYVLADGGIQSGGNPEVFITIHSKYLPEFKTREFCDVLTQANKNRDLGFETELGNTKLMWRYKGMMAYKDCLGMG